MSNFSRRYKPIPTGLKAHKSNAFIRGIMGPVRSGKSVWSCMELMRRMKKQKRDSSGFRRSRWIVVRNTYQELRDSTVKTWQMWVPPEHTGPFNHQQMTHNIQYDDIKAEVMFRALDRPDDVRKVLSTEYTGAWINEAREIPKGIVDGIIDRVGQYPSADMGGCTWAGVIMDTNPPDTDHWWFKVFEEKEYGGEEVDPNIWEMYRQPGALIETDGKFVQNPEAENINNLNEGIDYYLKRLAGKSKDHIRVYYCAEYGFVIDGKPVIPEYVDSVHCSPEIIKPNKSAILYVGLDFGLSPAALFAQKDIMGRWYWIDELVADDVGATRFAEVLKTKIQDKYSDYDIEIYGDPAGEQRAQTDENTVFEILEKNGIRAQPAPVPNNDFTIRRESIAVPLSRLIEGKPGLFISPVCKVARKGLAGGYHYKRVKISGEERYHDKPVKTKYSHVVEAGGYAMVGAGEGDAIITTRQFMGEIPNNKRFGTLTQVPHGWMAG